MGKDIFEFFYVSRSDPIKNEKIQKPSIFEFNHKPSHICFKLCLNAVRGNVC